jgi:hypothetical protein
MGHRIIQTIYTCDLCGETPEDGGKLWHMNDQVWCESCCDKVENEEIDENGNIIEVDS